MMMVLNSCLIIIPLTLVNAEYRRSKRIINGEPINEWDTGYGAMRYLASIGTLHGTGFYGRKYGYVYFSGAFITPGIVQTACHCMCYRQDRDETNTRPLKVKGNWENTVNVYVGAIERFLGPYSIEESKPMKSKKFIIHQGCAILPKGTTQMYTSDYGWVVLASGWDPKIEPFLTRVDFAPQYPLDQLMKIWTYLSERRSVCLHVGFGDNRRDMGINNELRAGWATLLTHRKCTELTSENLKSMDLVTWSCLIPFPKHEHGLDSADVGGPLTCNNFYFGIASESRSALSEHEQDLELLHFVSFVYDSPLAFATFENALEWRPAFISYIGHQGNKPICEVVCDVPMNPGRVIETYKPLREKRFEHERCYQ